MCGHVGLRPPVYSPELWDSSKRLQAKAILRHQSVPHTDSGGSSICLTSADQVCAKITTYI